MDIHDDVTVTLPYWKWTHFLGWLEAKAGNTDNPAVDDVITAISSGVIP